MRRAALLLAASLFASCSADLKEGHFACGPAGECPSGWFCRADNRCYSSAGGGGTDAGPRDAGPPFDAGPDYDAGPRPDAGGPPPTDAGSDAGCVPPLALCSGACVDPRTDPEHCGMTCEMCSGTTLPSCIGGSCVACMGPEQCDDGLGCTDDSCLMPTGTCDHAPNATGCLISGVCVPPGPRPGNPCQVCDPVRASRDWSNAGAGTPCDDGAPTTCGDACGGAGTCLAGPMPNCDDTNPCTTDSISCGAAGGCTHTAVMEGTCCGGTLSHGGCSQCWQVCRGGVCTDELPLCSRWAGCVKGPSMCSGASCSGAAAARSSDCDYACCNGVCCM